ncbi:SDR family oxidoreductase [Leifsonia shinshuensis]|uniref:SDR family NAD(P)-dependent oxidoreductase n=1 Tax=Leifsonia shinshuensis TaxID=150026 RepID=UPI001F508D09|nr:SDR family oxidoreductase [Leifsonia shinshuensis]MCI0155417.1 SDR family oxidoreductase [Leifsonia shinshuensis]
MSKQNTDQRIVVITGASSGIGRGAAIEIAARDMGVVVTYNARPEGADRTVEEIREAGGRAAALPLDFSRTETFPDFARALRDVLATEWGAGRLHALVNNAGFGGGRGFEEMTVDAFDDYYRVLLRGPYFLTQALLPLIEDGGAIVNTSSSSVRPGDTEPGFSGYAAMKGGLVIATRFLAKELSSRSIRVNAVSPGPTRTRLGDNAFERFPELIDGLAAKTAFGRIGEPADVGKVIAFLVSDDSAWITGEDIQASGGYSL